MLSLLDNEVLAQNTDGDVSVGQIVIVDTDAVVSISLVLLFQLIQCYLNFLIPIHVMCL